MSHYCTLCGNMIPAQGTHHCNQYRYVIASDGTGVPTNSTGLPIDARDAEIASLKFLLGSKDTQIASLRSSIVATIEAADKEIAELKAQVEKLKTCKNCKWQGSKFATCVQGCNWELEE
jgi:hypothetical protein